MVETRPDDKMRSALAQIDAAARAGDWTGASMLAEQCLTQSFEHPKLLQMRAISHERQGRLAEAQNDLERAHDLNPEDAGIAIALGILLVRQGHEDRATGLFEAQVAKTPAIPALHFHLGVAFMGKGDHARARLCFEQVVKLDPNAGEALGKLAVIAAHRGITGARESRRIRRWL